MEAAAVVKLLDDLSSRRGYVRLRALFFIVDYLSANYRIQFAEKNFATLLYACLKCIKGGFPEETVLATRALSLLSMTIGPGDQANDLYKEALIHQTLSSIDEPSSISIFLWKKLSWGKYGISFVQVKVLMHMSKLQNLDNFVGAATKDARNLQLDKGLLEENASLHFTPEVQTSKEDSAYYSEREELVVHVSVPMHKQIHAPSMKGTMSKGRTLLLKKKRMLKVRAAEMIPDFYLN